MDLKLDGKGKMKHITFSALKGCNNALFHKKKRIQAQENEDGSFLEPVARVDEAVFSNPNSTCLEMFFLGVF